MGCEMMEVHCSRSFFSLFFSKFFVRFWWDNPGSRMCIAHVRYVS
jgi:hypothetical protein